MVDRALAAVYATTSVANTLPITALDLFLARDLGMAPSRVQLYFTLGFVPAAAKALLGGASDALGRRRPVVVAGDAGSAVCMAATSAAVTSAASALLWIQVVVRNACLAAREAALDALVVAASAPGAHATVQSAAMAARTVGEIIGRLLSIALLAALAPRAVLALSAAVFVVSAVLSRVLLPPDAAAASAAPPGPGSSAPWRALAGPLLFVFAVQASPSPEVPVTVYLSTATAISQSGLSVIAFCSSLGRLAGAAAFAAAMAGLARSSLRSAFRISAVVAAAGAVPSLLMMMQPSSLATLWFGSLQAAVTGAASTVAFMPILVLSGTLAADRPAREGLAFGAFSSATSIAGIVSGLLSSALMDALGVVAGDWGALAVYVALCAALRAAAVLALVTLVPAPQAPPDSAAAVPLLAGDDSDGDDEL